MSATDEFIPTRQSLLSRLKDWNDQESWRTFFDIYWKLIYSTALKSGLTESEAQDVVQETIISVSKSVAAFEYDAAKGSFKGWLLQLTRWRITDQWRKRQKRIRSAPTEIMEQLADPGGQLLDSIWEAEWEKNLMEAAIERVKRKVDPKHYQIFDFYVLKKWPVARVARALKVSRAAVYVAKHRITILIKREVAQLRQKPI